MAVVVGATLPAARLVVVHVALVVPGGVDRTGQERTIPAISWLVERLTQRHRVTIVALGHEPGFGRWMFRRATVVNVPAEGHGAHRLARQLARAVRASGAEGRPDVVHALWASTSGLAAVLAARRHRVPSVVSVAGGELVAMRGIGYGGALGRGGRIISGGALRGATRVTVATDWMAEHVRGAGYAVTDVVPLGVDLATFAAPDGNGSPSRARHLVHVGNLNAVKDQALLLRAFAEARRTVADLTLEIVGVDTLDGRVQRLATELEVTDSVTFAGLVANDVLAVRLRGAALHVVTSRHDAGPVSVLEAAACGVPTVGTAVGHVADLSRLAPPAAVAVTDRDPATLARTIVALLGDDRRRAALADAARRWAETHDADATAARFQSIYEALVGR